MLWALSFGDAAAWAPAGSVRYRHRMGMGKPYGLGEIAIRLDADSFHVRRNDGGTPPGIGDLVRAFEAEMRRVTAGWRNLPQIRTLLAVADPAFGAARPDRSLDYMVLNPGKEDEFSDSKRDGHFLPDYMIESTGPPPGEPVVGSRIRVTLNGCEGVIQALRADAKNPQYLIKLANNPKPVWYRRNIFEVIE